MHHKNFVTRTAFWIMLLGLPLGDLAVSGAMAQGDAPAPRVEPPIIQSEPLRIAIGATRDLQLSTKEQIQLAKVDKPQVCSAKAAAPDMVSLSGLAAGVARVTLTPIKGRSETWTVIVHPDVEFLEGLLKQAVPSAQIEVIPAGSGTGGASTNSVLLKGVVEHADDVQTIMRTAISVLGTPNQVINAIRVAGVQQVQIDVVFARVSRTELRRMEMDFFGGGAHHVISSAPQGNLIFPSSGIAIDAATGMPTFTNAIGSPNNPSVFLGLFNPQQNFFGLLNILRRESLAKIMAEPKLVTMSGQSASILDGGEQPVPSPGGLGAVSVQFQPFGTRLSCLPIVMGSGRIQLQVEPEVSILDSASGSTIGGFPVQGRIVQRVRTTVEMEEGQTLVIGGLVQKTVDGVNNKIPILGDLPFIGAAFSGKRFEEKESELIVMLTPHLVDAADCSQFDRRKLPGMETRTPDDYELFLEGILEAPRGPRPVFPGKRYVPAYKNGPTAADYPCANDSATRNGIGSHSSCAGTGLANCSGMEYPNKYTPPSVESKPMPSAASHGAVILPPIDLDGNGDSTPGSVSTGGNGGAGRK